MTANRIARIVIALVGFAATGWGAIQADRLSVDGANAGPAEWAGVAGLFAITAAGAMTRVGLRTYEAAKGQVSGPDRMTGPLAAIGKESAALIAAGKLEGAAVLLEAAKKLKGAP